MQRLRLLNAALAVVDELGSENASVLSITARAGVSRRTFYELFENRDECLLAVLDGALRQVGEQVTRTIGAGEEACRRAGRGGK